MKDGKRINQRAFMHNSWRCTIQRLTWRGKRVGLGGGGEREEKVGTVIAQSIKKKF